MYVSSHLTVRMSVFAWNSALTCFALCTASNCRVNKAKYANWWYIVLRKSTFCSVVRGLYFALKVEVTEPRLCWGTYSQ